MSLRTQYLHTHAQSRPCTRLCLCLYSSHAPRTLRPRPGRHCTAPPVPSPAPPPPPASRAAHAWAPCRRGPAGGGEGRAPAAYAQAYRRQLQGRGEHQRHTRRHIRHIQHGLHQDSGLATAVEPSTTVFRLGYLVLQYGPLYCASSMGCVGCSRGAGTAQAIRRFQAAEAAKLLKMPSRRAGKAPGTRHTPADSPACRSR